MDFKPDTRWIETATTPASPIPPSSPVALTSSLSLTRLSPSPSHPSLHAPSTLTVSVSDPSMLQPSSKHDPYTPIHPRHFPPIHPPASPRQPHRVPCYVPHHASYPAFHSSHPLPTSAAASLSASASASASAFPSVSASALASASASASASALASIPASASASASASATASAPASTSVSPHASSYPERIYGIPRLSSSGATPPEAPSQARRRSIPAFKPAHSTPEHTPIVPSSSPHAVSLSTSPTPPPDTSATPAAHVPPVSTAVSASASASASAIRSLPAISASVTHACPHDLPPRQNKYIEDAQVPLQSQSHSQSQVCQIHPQAHAQSQNRSQWQTRVQSHSQSRSHSRSHQQSPTVPFPQIQASDEVPQGQVDATEEASMTQAFSHPVQHDILNERMLNPIGDVDGHGSAFRNVHLGQGAVVDENEADLDVSKEPETEAEGERMRHVAMKTRAEIETESVGGALLRDTIEAFRRQGSNEGRTEFVNRYSDLMKACEDQCIEMNNITDRVCLDLMACSRVPYLEDTVTAPVDDETAADARQKLVVKKRFVEAMEDLQGDHLPTKRRGNLPKESTAYLKQWFKEHRDHPYPSDEEKLEMSKITKIGMTQISHWFINYRKRVWKPNLPEGHPARSGDHSKKPRKRSRCEAENAGTS